VLIVLADSVGDGARFLAGLYSFGVLIAMTAAQLAVVRLRAREPDLPRPFRVPGNVSWRGVPIPVVPVVGALLTAVLWAASLLTHGGALVAGPVWLALGVVVYLLSRRAGGKTLMGRATPAVPDLVAAPEQEMGTILVPLKLSNVGEEVLATAMKLAEEREAAVHVLCVVKVPLSQPLDAVSGDDEDRAREALDEVREIAEEHGVQLRVRLVRARSLSEAIIAEAKELAADVIVVGSAPRWRSHKRFFSPTVDEVLRGAPCEVMVVTYPEGVLPGDEES
jgi:APA family basic amino acid/polyamine antiporter